MTVQKTNKLVLTPNLAHTDDLYQRIIDAHAGLSAAQSRRLNARLILILFNHIGDEDIINQAIDAALAV